MRFRFQVRPQAIGLDPMRGSDEETGRMDIVLIPPTNDEDIYFCLESKRLNVVKDGKPRSYASEYVKKGMIRFVTGFYAKAVRHGGMLAYVLDGDVPKAMINVEANIQANHAELYMVTPGAFVPSGFSPAMRGRERPIISVPTKPSFSGFTICSWQIRPRKTV